MRKVLLVLVVLVAVLGFAKRSPAPVLDPDQVISGDAGNFIDTPLQGRVDFWWYQDPGQPNDPIEVITLDYWEFQVQIDQGHNDDTIFYGKHKINPHAGETEAESMTYTSVSRWQAAADSLSVQSAHPPLGGHYDQFVLSWAWDAANNREHLIIEAEHIPEPATSVVLTLGLIPVLLRRNRNKRSKICLRH